MRINNVAIFPGGADASVDQTSQAFVIPNIIGWSAQLYITGSATGTIEVEASDDPGISESVAQQNQPVNWTVIAGSSQSISSAGNVMYNYGNATSAYNWIRFVFVNGGGTGSISGRLNQKGI